MFEAVGEAGEDLADVGNADLTADGGFAVGFEGDPEVVAREVTEGKVGVVAVVELLDEQEAGGEAIPQRLAPGDAVGGGEAFVDEIEGGEKEQRLVGPFMRRAFLQRSYADVEIVEAFDGLIQCHRDKEAKRLIEWKDKAVMN